METPKYLIWSSKNKKLLIQIKIHLKNLSSILEQVEDRISGLEDKVNMMEKKNPNKYIEKKGWNTKGICNCSVIPLKDQIYELWP
jgi:hypothetical protein